MSRKDDRIIVKIGKKSYHIHCEAEQIGLLKESTNMLNKHLDQMVRKGHALSTERTAMMAALNLAYELITTQKQQNAYIENMSQKIQELQQKIESALAVPE